MTDILSLSPLELLLIGIAAVGIFLFFRACWHNIQQSSQVSTGKHDSDTNKSS